MEKKKSFCYCFLRFYFYFIPVLWESLAIWMTTINVHSLCLLIKKMAVLICFRCLYVCWREIPVDSRFKMLEILQGELYTYHSFFSIFLFHFVHNSLCFTSLFECISQRLLCRLSYSFVESLEYPDVRWGSCFLFLHKESSDIYLLIDLFVNSGGVGLFVSTWAYCFCSDLKIICCAMHCTCYVF